ncbi:MAG TPA: M2 family metallopeptidase [Vicinamibacteria bacterium]|nr:M2 family metallopeptidase [Vicinamibacteria bacterium]
MSTFMTRRGAAAVIGAALAAVSVSAIGAAPAPPSAAEAQKFVDDAEARLMALSEEAGRAEWIKNTYITEDSEILAAQANQRAISAAVDYAMQATRFDGLALPDVTARKLKVLKLALTLPAPSDPKLAAELTRIVSEMEGVYGRGKYCRPGGSGEDCRDINALSRIMAESRDEKELLDVWRGWRTISPPLRDPYARYVELGNQGARELGFPDMGAMWRSKYDVPPDAFAAEVDRLWNQVRPLYLSLHTYVRRKLREQYGAQAVPERGPIPAHLLGNMWAQQWNNVYPLVAPPGGDPGIDLTEVLRAKKVDEKEMVRYGERFFTSLGFAPLPQTFWVRSLFVKPRDREVVCHASAWDIDNEDDLRIKMCIEITDEDFSTIHHELGHNFYQRAYKHQPFLFRDSAHDGFHEAIGDVVALSITPAYLKQLGFIEEEPDPSKDLGLLMQMALDKVAFLPFGLLVDQWRWKVLAGETQPARYNASWWELREKYQGVSAPVARSEADFDPGAKYHVPANVPYTRYFLAHILQFQFHRSLCQAAGYQGPLNRCSIYGNREAGARLRKMLEMGLSRPWPDALEAMTGQREMDATAILDYFAPLRKWLDEQNAGQPVGW